MSADLKTALFDLLTADIKKLLRQNNRELTIDAGRQLYGSLPSRNLPPASVSDRGGVTLSDATPADVDTAGATSGTAADVSRGDHAHDLAPTAVTPDTYGSASAVGVFTVDQSGRLTDAADVPIAIDGSAITSGVVAIDRGGTGAATFAQNRLLIGPVSGSPAAPTLRTLTDADIPSLPYVILTFSGLTTGQPWRATGATSAAFGALDLSNANAIANALPPANGGTGQSSYAVGDLLYASGSTALSKLADVATGNALISGGVTTAPAWGKIALTTHVSGILPSANGGTGIDNGGRTLTVSTNNGILDFLSSGLTLAYDQGTYTPTYQGGTTGGATTYTLQAGFWTRIGNVITVMGTVVWSAATGTGNARISLPFTSINTANQNGSGAVRVVNVTFANGAPQVLLVPNTSFFELQSPLTNAASTSVAVEAAGNIVFTISYMV